jgi:hypothetical protein
MTWVPPATKRRTFRTTWPKLMISPEVMATLSSSTVSDSEGEVSEASESSPLSGTAGGGGRSKYSVMLGSSGY